MEMMKGMTIIGGMTKACKQRLKPVRTEKIETEFKMVLDQMEVERCRFPEVHWFMRKASLFFQKEHLQSAKPELIILGEDFPQEIPLSFTPDTWFLLGGSLETAHWSDAVMPRDADPVSRSACGWLMNGAFSLVEKALVVIPLSSDNRRKLSGMLKRKGIQVLPVDMPPAFHLQSAQQAWVLEMLRVVEALERHTGIHLTVDRLNRTIDEKRIIQRAIRDFKEASWLSPETMTCPLRDFIVETVWYTQDKKEWARHLRILTGQMMQASRTSFVAAHNRPWTLMVGSPVIFPNTKLPILVEESGLYLADRIDSVAVQAEVPCFSKGRTITECLQQMAVRRLPMEVSGTWISNQGLVRAVERQIENLPIDGIIYHVLKGQVEYDFELRRIENLAAEHGLPLIRLETDYQKQDIEQLRIRLEAFSEMLRQRIHAQAL